jgi:hypothetical protein
MDVEREVLRPTPTSARISVRSGFWKKCKARLLADQLHPTGVSGAIDYSRWLYCTANISCTSTLIGHFKQSNIPTVRDSPALACGTGQPLDIHRVPSLAINVVLVQNKHEHIVIYHHKMAHASRYHVIIFKVTMHQMLLVPVLIVCNGPRDRLWTK